MSDYISKNALLEKLKYMGDYNIDMDYVTAEDIMSIPSADVRENIHGHWINSDIPESILSKCSVCGFQLGAFSFKFCPMCGADMRGRKAERRDKG